MYDMLTNQSSDDAMPELKVMKWLENNSLIIRIALLIIIIAGVGYLLYMPQEIPAYEFIMRDKAGSMLQCNMTDDTYALCSVFYCAESEGILSQQFCFDLELTQTMKIYP